LALLLKDPERYHSIYLLESGANFSDINAGMLFRRSEALAKIIWKHYVVNPILSGQNKIVDVRNCFVFGRDKIEMKKAWDQVERRVNSGEDIAKIDNDPFFFQSFVRRAEEADEIWDGVVLDIIDIRINNAIKWRHPRKECLHATSGFSRIARRASAPGGCIP
jgi:hypothetical protein